MWVVVTGDTGKISEKPRNFCGNFQGVFNDLEKAEFFADVWMSFFGRYQFVALPEVQTSHNDVSRVLRKEWETKDGKTYVAIRRVLLNPTDFEH